VAQETLSVSWAFFPLVHILLWWYRGGGGGRTLKALLVKEKCKEKEKTYLQPDRRLLGLFSSSSSSRCGGAGSGGRSVGPKLESESFGPAWALT
jgi:hypothetical protein